MKNGLTSRPAALYTAIQDDVKDILSFDPVGLDRCPPDASYKQFASFALLKNIMKKFIMPSSVAADASAKEKFLTSNKTCKDWKLQDLNDFDTVLVGTFQRELYDFFHPGGLPLVSSYYEILHNWRVGPGSAIGSQGFSLYAKLFSSRLTTTSPYLNLLFREYCSWFPTLHEGLARAREELGDTQYVRGSRISFAPKTVDTSRLICVEPSLNMIFQLGLGTILERRLKEYFHISLSDQPDLNRWLAYMGSCTDSISTIDLKSASDSISLTLCKRFLPDWFYTILTHLRSPYVLIDKDYVCLNMISTMGNGFTFPLQTIIFSCLIRAVYQCLGIVISQNTRHSLGNWGCFGDDIIVSRLAFRTTCRLLGILGFTPNGSKSFEQGPFRESCGADWFHGQPCRPVFIRRLGSLQDILVAMNQLNNWTSVTGIPLRKGIELLYSWIREPERLLVPFTEGLDSGLRVPLSYVDVVRRDKNGTSLYWVFRPRPIVYRVHDGAIVAPRGFKKLLFNPEGLEISFLYGELRDYAIMVRNRRVTYSRKRGRTPYWDYLPEPNSFNGQGVSWQRWESAVWTNLANTKV